MDDGGVAMKKENILLVLFVVCFAVVLAVFVGWAIYLVIELHQIHEEIEILKRLMEGLA